MALVFFFVVWIVVSLVLGSIGVSLGSWQRPSQDRRLVFCTPKAQSAAIISFCSWIFFCPALFASVGMFSLRSYSQAGTLGYGLLLIICVCMAYGLASLLLRASAPQETEIDLERRVFRHTCGWGRGRRVWTVPLDQVSAVCVGFRNSVYLSIEEPLSQQKAPPFRVTLGQFAANGFVPIRPRVLSFAHEMADALGLRVLVNLPPPQV